MLLVPPEHTKGVTKGGHVPSQSLCLPEPGGRNSVGIAKGTPKDKNMAGLYGWPPLFAFCLLSPHHASNPETMTVTVTCKGQ
jgi:hypothetical protein